MPHTNPEQLATISAEKVEERFRGLHPIVALVSATRLMQYLEREGLMLQAHRRLCACIIREALPTLEAGPGHDPENLPELNVRASPLQREQALAPAVASFSPQGAPTPATVHDKPQGVVS